MSKRQDIMNATLDLIDEEGLQSVTFSKIFKRANVGSGTVFNYFGSKEELINEVYKEARMHLGRCLMAGYDPGARLYERFKRYQLNKLRFALDFRKEFMFIDSYSYSPYIDEDIRNMDDADRSRQTMLDLLAEGQAMGLIGEMDVRLCHSIVHGIIATIVKGFFVDKYPLTDLQEQQALEASWKAIRL